ncbi:MAG: caspase family protein [Clostridia bacterium]|nr:caspase family protein [Clostridia bacterium]
MKRLLLLCAVLLLLPLCAHAVTSVPDGVVSIGDEAFAGTDVSALIVPASCQSVGANVLAGCNASYLHMKSAATTLASGAAADVPFIFAPSGSSAAGLPGFYAVETLTTDSGLYYAVTDTALPLCAKDPDSMNGTVTIPKLLNGVPVTSLEVLDLSNTEVAELCVPSYLSIPEGMNVQPYDAMTVSAPTAGTEQIPAGKSTVWTTSATGQYGSTSYIWLFTNENSSYSTITAEPSVTYTPLNQGSCSVTVTVEDALGDRATAQSANITVTEPQPTYRAVLISNTYPGTGNELPGCDNDAAAMATMLSTMTATPYQVTRYENLNAAAMRSVVKADLAQAQAGDVSLFYFSGHGTAGGSLMGTENTFLSASQLRLSMDMIPGIKIIIIDCCYSGALIAKDGGSGGPSSFNRDVISAFSGVTRAGELIGSSFYVLTACSGEQESSTIMAGDIDFGAFTYGLCYGSGYDEWNGEHLPDLPADTDGNSAISLTEAQARAMERVEYLSSLMEQMGTGSLEQSVQCYPGGSGFILWAR